MKKYSKLIGMVVGLIVAALANAGLLQVGVDTSAFSEAIYVILGGVGVVASPKNAE